MFVIALALTVRWVIVPLIMLTLLVFSQRISRGVGLDPDRRISARAGFWMGLLLTLIFVIAMLGNISGPSIRLEDMPQFSILPLLMGTFAGFAMLFGIFLTLPTRFLGVIIIAMSALSSSALFSYFFIPFLHGWVLYWTLGAALGCLIFIVFFPGPMRQIFGNQL
jgi:hypothetical protein